MTCKIWCVCVCVCVCVIPSLPVRTQSKLTDLKDLDLFNCPVTAVEGYRERVFKLLPDLKSLDGFDQNGQEVNPPGEEDDEDDEEEEEEEEEGPGLEYLQQDILVCVCVYMCIPLSPSPTLRTAMMKRQTLTLTLKVHQAAKTTPLRRRRRTRAKKETREMMHLGLQNAPG